MRQSSGGNRFSWSLGSVYEPETQVAPSFQLMHRCLPAVRTSVCLTLWVSNFIQSSESFHTHTLVIVIVPIDF